VRAASLHGFYVARMAAGEFQFKRVVIFERDRTGTCGFGVRERVAACFRLARSRGWIVEELCQPGDVDADAELDRALEICQYTGASLLTYDAGAKGPDRFGAVELLEACTAIGAPR
jgi:hypothetical protein